MLTRNTRWLESVEALIDKGKLLKLLLRIANQPLKFAFIIYQPTCYRPVMANQFVVYVYVVRSDQQ